MLKMTLKLGTLKMLMWEDIISYGYCCSPSACFEKENSCQGHADIFCRSEAGSEPPSLLPARRNLAKLRSLCPCVTVARPC